MAYHKGNGRVLDGSRSVVDGERALAPAPILPVLAASEGRRFRQTPSEFPEIDCLCGRLPVETLAAAARRAGELGVGVERVLIAAGVLDEDSYVAAVGHWLNLPCETFQHLTRKSCPLDDRQLITAARTGLLPLIIGGEPVLVLAPRSMREFLTYTNAHPNVRFRLTSAVRLNGFISGCAEDALGVHAADALKAATPRLSAGSSSRGLSCALAAMAMSALAALIAFPYAAMNAFGTILTFIFLLWLGLRVFGSCLKPATVQAARIAERELPIYTIIVALYHEAAALEDLIACLCALDYPREKLDIKLAVEADDQETLQALARLPRPLPFEVIIAPQYGPRTKPKALNAALAFARGTFTVIYDAEDRPEPNQLRRALEAFRAEAADLACVQASLTVDNTDDSWLAALFTAEYAAQFDLFLPGLCMLRLPLPLGGSSNHFRTAVLREVGAWDPYNVTEDADLGMRLARLGFRSAMIASTTYEEAPTRPGLWLRQRSRWFKGWLQTWAVHMRAPVRLWRELGPAGFMAFQLVVGGNVLAALVHPFFLAWLFYRLTLGPGFSTAGEPDGGVLTVFYGVAFFAGYVVSITFGFVGLARRGLWKSTWALAFVVPHWMLLSVAAWRALFHLAWNPYGWEKTTHGLGKSSRRARLNSSATLTALFRNESAAPATERSSVPSNATPGNGLLRSEPSLPAQTRQAAA